VVAIVDVADIALPEGLRDPCDLTGTGWGCEQMDVVGHQHIGMQGALFLEADFARLIKVALPIHVGEEARLAIIAASNDVLCSLLLTRRRNGAPCFCLCRSGLPDASRGDPSRPSRH
jgi:hypothetical protein